MQAVVVLKSCMQLKQSETKIPLKLCLLLSYQPDFNQELYYFVDGNIFSVFYLWCDIQFINVIWWEGSTSDVAGKSNNSWEQSRT